MKDVKGLIRIKKHTNTLSILRNYTSFIKSRLLVGLCLLFIVFITSVHSYASSDFQAAVNYTVGGSPQSVTTGDFNDNMRLDLAVANGGSNNVSILRGNGNGTFQAAVNYTVGGSPQSVTTGDFNDNMRLDLAVANGGSNNVSILLAAIDTDDINGGGGGGGSCFIATAAFGSPMQPYVKILRDFRDRFLFGNKVGKSFMRLYNTYSPPMADFIAKHDSLRAMVRISLLPVVGISWITLKIGPVSTVVLMLLFISCFVGLVWFRRRYKE